MRRCELLSMTSSPSLPHPPPFPPRDYLHTYILIIRRLTLFCLNLYYSPSLIVGNFLPHDPSH